MFGGEHLLAFGLLALGVDGLGVDGFLLLLTLNLVGGIGIGLLGLLYDGQFRAFDRKLVLADGYLGLAVNLGVVGLFLVSDQSGI